MTKTWESRISNLSVQIDSWQERTREVPEIETGSSLAGDEQKFRGISNPIWYSICVSTEHLGFTADVLRETARMYPSAYMTVLRTAYITAVNAIWMLAPANRNERIVRGLIFQRNDLKEQVKYFNRLGQSPDSTEELLRPVMDQIEEERNRLDEIAVKYGVSEQSSKRFIQTTAVDWVANYLNAEDPLLKAAYSSLWNTGSAAAHGQPYFGAIRINQNESISDGSGGASVKLRGDLDKDVGPSFGGTTLILSKAFELYDLRRNSYHKTNTGKHS